MCSGLVHPLACGIMLDDLEFIEIDLATCYRHDDEGHLRLAGVGERATPPFVLARTAAGDVLRFRSDLPEETVEQIAETCQREPPAGDLRDRPDNYNEIQDILQAHEPLQRVGVSLVYRFPEDMRPHRPLVEITSANLQLLADIFPDLDIDQPCLAVLEDGRAVSVCQTVGAFLQARVAGVDTMEAYRRRGYAAATVAGWGLAVRELGHIPLYSTRLDNAASQGVARKVGLRLYGAVHHFT